MEYFHIEHKRMTAADIGYAIAKLKTTLKFRYLTKNNNLHFCFSVLDISTELYTDF